MVLICGHRGTPAHRPENTLAGFAYAHDLGATWIEFDVRPAGDGELVVHHDPVDRHGNTIAAVSSSALDADVPTLAAVVEACPHLGLDIELKTDEIGQTSDAFARTAVEQVHALLADRLDTVVVTSFDAATLALFREAAPGVGTGLLFHDRSGEWAIAEALRSGHGAIVPWHPLVNRRLVDDAHEAGLDVMTWTVNSAAAAKRVLYAGVDMIIGDDPSLLIAVADQHD